VFCCLGGLFWVAFLMFYFSCLLFAFDMVIFALGGLGESSCLTKKVNFKTLPITNRVHIKCV
jgi:hypothetical protein